MRILNLYAGIGGNRKLWGGAHQITAIEYDPVIAGIYKDHFPNDEVIVTDAHEYLLKHMNEYDFIWASPPCPTHSDIRRMAVHAGKQESKYPDMTLYQEIILLRHFYKREGLYCVENVKPYYEPLIPAQERERHLFWANFYIHDFEGGTPKHFMNNSQMEEVTGFDLSKYKGIDKRQVYRNCVDSRLGLHVLESAIKNRQLTLV